ncbi:MAG: hypothetical protein GY940_07605, partial [bacterium]|nr:hypothetical protein [bacterium]
MGSKTVKLSKILPVILVMMVMAVMVIMIGDVFISTGLAEAEHLFKDDFENGAGKWNFTNSHKINIHESGDKTHGKVLTLQPGGPEVYALIKDSADWNNYKLEGEILFTSYSHHYIGFVYNYNYNYSESRADMGAICVYGPRGVEIEKLRSTYVKYTEQPPADFMANVVMVNPHLDGNAHRALYPEYWVMLKEEKGIKPRTWHRFKAEVMGAAVHFYLDDMETPKITYNHLQLSSGSAGFKPRYTGSPCRLDNISAARI